MNAKSKNASLALATLATLCISLPAAAIRPVAGGGGAGGSLHGFCYAPTPACIDNGTVTPTSTNPPDFGFWYASGPGTGDYLVEILVPDSNALPSAYLISGTQGGASNTSPLLATTTYMGDWTSGKLDAFLGLTASPKNPVGAWGGTGYYVFQADLGTNRLQPESNDLSGPLLSIGSTLDLNTVIVGFLNVTGTDWVATANSAAIYETGSGPPPPAVPEPATLALFGAALLGCGMWMNRRSGMPKA